MGEWKCGWTPKLKQLAESYGVDTSIPLEEYVKRANQDDASLIDRNEVDDTFEVPKKSEFNVYYSQNSAYSKDFSLTVDVNKLIFIDEPVILIGSLKSAHTNIAITNYAVYLLDSSKKPLEKVMTFNDGKFKFSLDSRELYEKNGSNQVLFVKTGSGYNEIKLPIRFIIQDNS